MKFLLENRSEECTASALEQAAAKGHLEIVKFLLSRRFSSCSTKVMDNAADNGHCNIVRWLHFDRTEGCTQLAVDEAAMDGHLAVVQFLYRCRQMNAIIGPMRSIGALKQFAVLEWVNAESPGFRHVRTQFYRYERTLVCTMDTISLASNDMTSLQVR